MKLVLEISRETDLQMLLMLLERLKIPYTKLSERTSEKKAAPAEAVTNGVSTQKNFDAEAIQKILTKMQKHKVFAEITDPVEWQRQLRNEWE